ncbi:MAG TPA: transporter substrate-binding domain-containing protein, partial [Dongiaceae bacterium]
YRNKDGPISETRAEDIPAGSIIGVVSNYEYPSSVDRLKERGIRFEVVNSESALLKMLASRRIDLAILMLNGLKTEEMMMRDAGVSNVTYAFPCGDLGAYIGFSLRNPQGDFARRKFNQGLAAISKNGQLDAIAAKWHIKLADL